MGRRTKSAARRPALRSATVAGEETRARLDVLLASAGIRGVGMAVWGRIVGIEPGSVRRNPCPRTIVALGNFLRHARVRKYRRKTTSAGNSSVLRWQPDSTNEEEITPGPIFSVRRFMAAFALGLAALPVSRTTTWRRCKRCPAEARPPRSPRPRSFRKAPFARRSARD